MMRWVAAFMVLLTLVAAAAILCVALLRPKHHDHARQMKGYRMLECTYQVLSEGPTYRKLNSVPNQLHVAKTTVQEEIRRVQSKNWAGYVVSDDLSEPTINAVKSVSASWTVPRLLPRKPVTAARYSSIWIGIDGYAPKSLALQQIGTESDWDPVSGQQVNFAWFNSGNQGPTMIVNFPVSIGDSISASVKCVDAKTGGFSMTIKNDTHGVAVVVPSSFTSSPHAQGMTAQFIVEAPSNEKTTMPLADFGATTFHNCLCTIRNKLAPIKASDRQFAPIDLIVNPDQPILTKIIAACSPLTPDAKAFTVSFLP